MNNNIQSCDITYSDIDNNDNKVLRNMYKNIYCCNYEKYIRLINNNYHIKIKNFNNSDNNDENEEEENKQKEDKNEDKNKDIKNYKNNKNTDIDNNKKKPKSKYYRILKIFNKNLIINKNEKKKQF